MVPNTHGVTQTHPSRTHNVQDLGTSTHTCTEFLHAYDYNHSVNAHTHNIHVTSFYVSEHLYVHTFIYITRKHRHSHNNPTCTGPVCSRIPVGTHANSPHTVGTGHPLHSLDRSVPEPRLSIGSLEPERLRKCRHRESKVRQFTHTSEYRAPTRTRRECESDRIFFEF